MKNVYNIRKDENLNFILSDKYINNKNKTFLKKEVAVFIHLHYNDTAEDYFKYISNINESIDIYITVSDETTKMKIRECIDKYKIMNCIIIDKKNRGRDVSALLVACRDKILEYEYVCFIHDKKEKNNTTKKDVQCWIHGLWENTIGSIEYIYNVIELFAKNKKLGILVPPNPVTDHISFALSNSWYSNFSLTKKLATDLYLDCDLNEDISPITLGTVFWCRVDALRKLFLKNWVYEDFQEEPMDPDGTISHAIERIIAYVAQDAGYYTGNIMTDTYAGKQFEYREMILSKAFDVLDSFLGVGNIYELYNCDLKRVKLEDFSKVYSDIFIFGAGVYGSRCFRMMKIIGRKPKAFLVSDGKKTKNNLYDIPVLELSKAEINEHSGIILAVGLEYVNDLKTLLVEKKIDNYIIFIEN